MNMFFKKYDNTDVLNIFSAVLFLSLFLTSIVLVHHSAIISFTFADSDKGQENKEKHDTNQSHQSKKTDSDKKSGDNGKQSSEGSNKGSPKDDEPPKENEPPKDEEPPKENEPPKDEEPPNEQESPSPAIITNTVTTPSVSSSSNDEDDDNNEGNEGPTKFAFVDSFFTDQTAQGSVIAETSSVSSGAQDIPPVQKQEVGPGEGDSILAIVLINRGFSDVTSIRASLDFPPGFTANVSPKNIDNDTALATYNGQVNAGQPFTLYFPVTISKDTLVGKEYTASLKIRYFNVAEQDEEDTRDRTIKIPLKLSGKVILDAIPFSVSASSQSVNNTFQDGKSSFASVVSLVPGEPNLVETLIKNEGSASATGVIVEVSSRDQQDQLDNNNVIPKSSGNGNTSTTTVQQSTVIPLINSGTTTFNVGAIPAGGSVKINPVIFASNSVGSILENIHLKISYNDAYGNKKEIDRLMGVHILPSSPQSGLTLSPTVTNSDTIQSGTSLSDVTIQNGKDDSANRGNGNNEYKNQTFSYPLTQVSEFNFNENGIIPNEIENNDNNKSDGIDLPSDANANANKSIISLIAGRVDDLKFNITNTNTNTITDVVISLNTDSSSMKILGDSKWNLNKINPFSTQEFITSVFASKSLINSPVSFKVSIQYIYNNQVKSDSLNLGANVIGDITVNINDLAVNYIGGNPNLVGNILNKGNTLALFTTIELLNPSSTINGENQTLTMSSTPMSRDYKNKNILIPASSFPQYLGDLEENSPLPFSIPLAMKNSSTSAIYPVSLKVTYSDDLRNGYTVISNGTVEFSAPVTTGNQGQTFLGNYTMIFFVMVTIVAVIIGIVILRRFRSKIKTKSLEGELKDNEANNSPKDDSQNDEDIETLLGGEDASYDENFKKQ
ncbi:MAG: hypothetical protein WA932_08415 [Nitrososphaeraceae archaeon]